MDKVFPNDMETEKIVLASFMINDETLIDNVRLLLPEDFYKTSHQMIYSAIYELFEDGQKVNLISIADHLRDTVIDYGGASYLASIIDCLPGTTDISTYIHKLKEKSKLRRLIIQANDTINSCYKNEDSDNIIDIHQSEVENIKIGIGENESSGMVEDWINQAPGEFNTKDLDFDLNIRATSQKRCRTKILEKLIVKGIIERSGKKRGTYRPTQKDLNEMDFAQADENSVKIWLPFCIHKAVKIMPGNIIQISGEKNAGKTALMLNIIKSNMRDFNIHYFNSEMGPQELKLRLGLFDDIPLSMWNFKAYSRSDNFSDVIAPGEGNLNIIDFLECHDEFYKMGQYMKDIHDKLNGAIAIVCIQKNFGATKGLGGNRTEEKPRLILSVSSGTLKIQMAKNWQSKDNPNGKSVNFKLANGCRFVQNGDWYKEE